MANKQNDDYHTEEEDERYDGVESKYNDEKENASNYNDEENQIRTPRKQFEVNKDTMDAMDLDGDGKVSNEEMNMKVTIEKAWQKFDEDGNGYIEEHELEDILDQIDDTFLNENNLDDVLEELDSDNHDGKIDKHEFTKWIMKQANTGEDGEQSELSKRLTAMAKKVTQSSKTDIHKACWENDIVIVSYFLDIDAARPKEMGETKLVNMPDKTGNEEGQNPELFEGDDNTPLHYAAYQGHLELCKLLCDRGANVNATNGDGCTPLFLASQQNRIDVVRYLLEPRLSCQLSICDKEYGLSAFDVAASEEVTLIFKSTRHLEKPGPIAKPVIKPCTSDQKSQSDVIVSFQPYTESDSYKKVNASNSKGMDLPIRGYVVEVAEKTTHPQWDYRQTKVADSTTDQLFDDFDENKDGGVSRDELKGFLLHIDKKFFDHYKPEIDEDDDDEEANMGGDDERKMLDQLFAQLDADGSGIIDKREFIDFLRGEDACRISSAKKLKQKMEELEHKLVKPAGSDLSVRFTGLEEGKKYIARVAVVNGIGIGEWSGISRRAYTWSRPQRIENVNCITRGATRITLSYDKLFKTNSNGPVDPENAKAKEKEQCRLAEQVREILVVGQIDGTGKDTLFASSMDPYNEDCKIVVKKLKECCTYSFKMIARNKCGTSAKSNAVKVTTRQIGEKEEKETDLDLRNHRIYDES